MEVNWSELRSERGEANPYKKFGIKTEATG